jgi:hypothetical protein
MALKLMFIIETALFITFTLTSICIMTESLLSTESKASPFREALQSMIQSMPLMMHGAGDVVAESVETETSELVASLTAHYIASLADAAIQVHRIQAPHAPHSVPPPRFATNTSLCPLPPLRSSTSMTNNGNNNKQKRSFNNDMCWDEPLPPPKIKNRTPIPPVDRDEAGWVGIAGCDFESTSRVRRAYVSSNNALSTHTFLFPICHDAYAYGRVTQVQASKRSLLPILTDTTTMEVVKAEAASRKKNPTKSLNKKRKTVDDNEDADDDNQGNETDSDEEGGEEDAAWPAIDLLLPSYRSLTDNMRELATNIGNSL